MKKIFGEGKYVVKKGGEDERRRKRKKISGEGKSDDRQMDKQKKQTFSLL